MNQDDYFNNSELTHKINDLFRNEVNKKAAERKLHIEEDFKSLKADYKSLKTDYETIKQSYEMLLEDNEATKDFNNFKNLITEDNIEDLVELLGLKKTKYINFHGMDTESVPSWFKLLCLYYPEKEKIFKILDMFGIDYPKWAIDFKLPSDYGEEELDLFFDHLRKMYVTNGEIYSHNMGFFWRGVVQGDGDFKKMISSSVLSYIPIPWNLLLQNPLLNTEKYINKIDKATNPDNPNVHSEYFYRINKYQEIEDELYKKLANNIPSNINSSIYKYFMVDNKNIFKDNPKLADRYKDKMTYNNYSNYHFTRFPSNMQKEYIKNLNTDVKTKFELIGIMDASTSEKIKLASVIKE